MISTTRGCDKDSKITDRMYVWDQVLKEGKLIFVMTILKMMMKDEMAL